MPQKTTTEKDQEAVHPAARKRHSRESTMQKLRQAGLEVFAKHGFDGATTKMVAEQAHVNEALIMRYFGSKEGLLNAIIQECTRDIDAKASLYPAGSTLEEELVNFLTGSVAVVSRNPAFFRLVLSRALLSPAARRTVARELQSIGEARLLVRLAELQEQRTIDRSVDLQELVSMLRLFIAGLLLDRLAITSSGLNPQRAAEQIARAIASTFKTVR